MINDLNALHADKIKGQACHLEMPICIYACIIVAKERAMHFQMPALKDQNHIGFYHVDVLQE